MNILIERLHEFKIKNNRVKRLAEVLKPHFDRGGSILDVGTGDGALLKSILSSRPDLQGQGIDIGSRVDVSPDKVFDGKTIPFPSAHFDWALLVDVLHHTEDPAVLLKEAARVARFVIIKDHLADGFLARPTLKFMDRVANERYGVSVPARYLTESEWRHLFETLNLRIEDWRDRIQLYPQWIGLPFNRNLHFVARVKGERE